jgi:hypothetical protein
VQFTAVPARQLPPWQVSAPLQALPSPQFALLSGVWTHIPPPLQVSVVQGLSSSQPPTEPATQVPALHVLAVPPHAAGPQMTPSITFARTQPLVGSQLAVLHGSLLSVHVSGVPALHTPA